MKKEAVTSKDETKETREAEFGFYEFFAGGGMARAGLGKRWRCLFANDMDPIKTANYIENWGNEHFDNRDVREVNQQDASRAVSYLYLHAVNELHAVGSTQPARGGDFIREIVDQVVQQAAEVISGFR